MQYIDLYGDRCPEELKLETATYRTKPYLLAKNIINAADCDNTSTKKLPKQGVVTEFLAKRAANGIKLRESSRMSRGKIFGLVRRIILKIADVFYQNGRIDVPEDIFYLQFNELFEAVQQRKMELRKLIETRRETYKGFDKLPLYSRLVFAGDPFDKQFPVASTGSLINTDTLKTTFIFL